MRKGLRSKPADQEVARQIVMKRRSEGCINIWEGGTASRRGMCPKIYLGASSTKLVTLLLPCQPVLVQA